MTAHGWGVSAVRSGAVGHSWRRSEASRTAGSPHGPTPAVRNHEGPASSGSPRTWITGVCDERRGFDGRTTCAPSPWRLLTPAKSSRATRPACAFRTRSGHLPRLPIPGRPVTAPSIVQTTGCQTVHGLTGESTTRLTRPIPPICPTGTTFPRWGSRTQSSNAVRTLVRFRDLARSPMTPIRPRTIRTANSSKRDCAPLEALATAPASPDATTSPENPIQSRVKGPDARQAVGPLVLLDRTGISIDSAAAPRPSQGYSEAWARPARPR